MTGETEKRRERLVEIFNGARDCVKCDLSATRTQVVFGSGKADADLMFVGEAPGAEEDRQGLPFAGRSGNLLTKMLGEVGIDREDVFITNTLKCRPPGNRNPSSVEIETCQPWLYEQIRLIQPRVVATLGNFSTKLLTGSHAGITKVHGIPQVTKLGVRTVFLLPLFHPAAALRSKAPAEALRADLAILPELLKREIPVFDRPFDL